MKIPELFREYIWLVNTIRRAGRISLAELNAKWVATDMSGGVEMARTTFNRHKDAIEDIFGIFIDCDRRSGYRYFIGNPRVLEEDTVQHWMLSTLSLGNLISESLSLQDRIIAEHVAVDESILRQLTRAMKTGHRVNIRYRQYGSPQCYWQGADPYCLKLFHRQWYLLGRLYGHKYMMFALSKIEEVVIQQHKFRVAGNFDAGVFFAPYFGVYIDEDIPTERILLRAFGDERFGLADVPMHRSQVLKATNEDEDYADLEVTLKPTPDFIDFLLSQAGRLRVLSPQSVTDKVNARLKQAYQ